MTVQIRSLLNGQETQIKLLRPLNSNLVLEAQSGETTLGGIIIPDVSDGTGFSILSGKLLAAGNKPIRTRKGPVEPGSTVIYVRVVAKQSEEVDLRVAPSGGKVVFIDATHALAVVDGGSLEPINDVSLVKVPQLDKDKPGIIITGQDNLSIMSYLVLKTGPDVDQFLPGEYVVTNKINGVNVDLLDVIRKHGKLKLIKPTSILGAGSTSEVDGSSYGVKPSTHHGMERL